MSRLVMAAVLLFASDKDDLAPATGCLAALLIVFATIAIGFAACSYLEN